MDLDSALEDKPAEGATASEILRADHSSIERLFTEYERAADEPNARHVALEGLSMQLELHDNLEISVFYPAMQEREPQLAAAARSAHDSLRKFIVALRERAGDSQCGALVTALKAEFERHVAEEEEPLLAALERCSDRQQRELGTALIRRKEELTRSTAELEGPAT